MDEEIRKEGKKRKEGKDERWMEGRTEGIEKEGRTEGRKTGT